MLYIIYRAIWTAEQKQLDEREEKPEKKGETLQFVSFFLNDFYG